MAFSVASGDRSAPPCPRDEQLMSKALAVSLLLHAIVLCGGIFAYWFTLPAPVVGPRAIDVTLVELSAFDTVLPPPQLPPQEPKARAIIPQPLTKAVEQVQQKKEEKRIEVKEAPKVKREVPPTSQEQRVASASLTTRGPSVGGGNEVTQKARVSYHHMVATLLAKAKRYPDRAVRGRVTGSGAVRLTILSSGAVERVEVATSTTSSILDDELLRMVERAAPFPSFPTDMNRSDVTLLVPVSFRLEN
jgi:protein TonB